MSYHDTAYIAMHQPGPLDAAIDDIKKVRNSIAGVPLFDGDAELVEGYDAAIRILEAAAKVGPEVNDPNGERWEWFISGLRPKWPELAALLVTIHAALPDGGGEQ